jgi:hypothetical protein
MHVVPDLCLGGLLRGDDLRGLSGDDGAECDRHWIRLLGATATGEHGG